MWRVEDAPAPSPSGGSLRGTSSGAARPRGPRPPLEPPPAPHSRARARRSPCSGTPLPGAAAAGMPGTTSETGLDVWIRGRSGYGGSGCLDTLLTGSPFSAYVLGAMYCVLTLIYWLLYGRLEARKGYIMYWRTGSYIYWLLYWVQRILGAAPYAPPEFWGVAGKASCYGGAWPVSPCLVTCQSPRACGDPGGGRPRGGVGL